MIILAVCAFAFFISFVIYNSIIGKKNQIENALGGLDAHLKQRYDLIPNLVATVKQYMQHEAGTLEKIVQLRSQAMNPDLAIDQKQNYNHEISKIISNLVLQVEQYPELKASANFQSLQNTLYDVEQNIAASRRFYNSSVTDFNNSLEMFPSNFFARFMGLTRVPVFVIPDVERQPVSVKNLFDHKAS